MKAEKFICVWKEFIGGDDFLDHDKGETWHDAWYKNTEWTKRTIGYACTALCPSDNNPEKDGHSPFGEYLVNAMRTGSRYQKEYKHVDLVIARKDNMRRPYSWEGEGFKQEDWDKRFEPILPEILIEQEGGCGKSWEEMAKLILLRSRLKVLITYTEDADNEKSTTLIERTCAQFKAMLEDAWRECPEFEETEYLLIIGQLDETGSSAKANWYCSIFSPRGTKVPDEAWMEFSTPSVEA